MIPNPSSMDAVWAVDCGGVHVVFGDGGLDRLGELASELGGRRTLLVTDGGILRAGHAERAADSLRRAAIEVRIFADAGENPTTREVECGVALPFLFVYRPQLLMLSPDGGPAPWWAIAVAFCLVGAGIVPLAAGIAGHLGRPLGPISRVLLLAAAGCLFYPGGAGLVGELPVSPANLAGAALVLVVIITRTTLVWRRRGFNCQKRA